jgi:two-component system, sensor histidine kinase PdtaS
MENTIAVIDATSCALFIAALLVVLVRSMRREFHSDSAFFMVVMLILYVFVQVSNVLEHLGITASLDYYEDFAEMLFPFFFIAFLNSMRLHADIERRIKDQLRLDAMVKERDELLKEIHHRVKNNLQVVMSIISLRRRQRDVDPKADQMLLATERRIFSMASVHEVIYRFEHAREIPVASFLRPIINRASASLPPECSRSVQTTVEIDPELTLSLELAVPLGLLVNELMASALHRVCLKGVAESKVEVKLARDNGTLLLHVRDDGIPAPDEGALEGEAMLSSMLIRNLIAQLGGTQTVSTDGVNVTMARWIDNTPQS